MDGVSVDERDKVGFLDEEFIADALRRKLLRANQPPHGVGPNAQPRGHLSSGEVQPVSLGPHGEFASLSAAQVGLLGVDEDTPAVERNPL
jgi:hypothetical protein